MRTSRLHLIPVLAVLSACGEPAPEADPAQVPLFALSEAPTLEIGVLEGDEDYILQNVVSVLPTASGNVVVADAGASEVLTYDGQGSFVRRWGGRGEGPGEFRNLIRLYSLGPDSLMALDGWTGRVSLFDTAGGFSHQRDATELASDTVFAMDVWLYRRFWVDGALSDGDRNAVKAALDRLPPPTSAPGYRFVRVSAGGDLWVREPGVDAGGNRAWTIIDPDKGPRASIRIPVRLEPQTIEGGRVLGRWLGENDVQFVRAYDVTDTGARAPIPGWMRGMESTEPVAPPDEEAFMGAIRTSLMGMARAQEIHYSTAMTYTARLDSLEWERPDDVVVDVIDAGPRGWLAVFTHPGLDRICGLGYGFTVPPGWAPGGVLCGPAEAQPNRGQN